MCCFLTASVFSLSENATFNSSSEAERKTQRYYLSCLQEQKIEELGSQPLMDLIEKVSLEAKLGIVESVEASRGLFSKRDHANFSLSWLCCVGFEVATEQLLY